MKDEEMITVPEKITLQITASQLFDNVFKNGKKKSVWNF